MTLSSIAKHPFSVYRFSAVMSILVLLPLAGARGAQTGTLGLGVVLGAPIGFDAKYWLSEKSAIDGAIGWRFETPNSHFCGDDDNENPHFDMDNDEDEDEDCHSRTRLDIHSDYLWHFDPVAVPRGRLPFNIGLGLRILTPDTEAGIRIPLGVSYLPESLPIDIFVDLAPIITFAPYGGADFDGGIGVRYYFGPGANAPMNHRR